LHSKYVVLGRGKYNVNIDRKIWLALVACVLVMAGCEETASKQEKVTPPAATPVPAPEYVRETLPLPQQPPLTASLLDTRPAIDILVAQVQNSFDEGQKEYLAGNYDKARASFDHAVDLILRSGFQADSDPRLSQLFDKIGDAMQSYDLDASETGQGEGDEAEAPGVPAPIDELANLTLPAGDARLALKAESELIAVPHDLPLTVNPSVLQYLSYFTTPRGRAIVERGLERAGRYDSMIRRVLKEEGVPQDLIYLAQAESAFLPDAVSNKGARGIWQFMPFRGQEYDLERTYYVDERSDPEKATRAAAHHLRDLYSMFGDWYLVMAAYNSGPLNVVKAVQRTGYADFWELQKRHALPRQTQNYVPIIIALALVAKDPALYGVQVQPEKPDPTDVIQPGHAINLHLVADATGADVDELHQLNPELLRSVTPDDPNFALKVPAGAAQKFHENIQQVPPDKWTSWRLHPVSTGESLQDVAREYKVTVAAIESANHLDPQAEMPAGFLLNVPTPPPVARLIHYRVRRGDTLEGIAGQFDVTVSEIKRWNHLRGSKAPRGAHLRIFAGGEPAGPLSGRSKSAQNESPASVRNVSSRNSEKHETVQHRVRPGETLYSIARNYGTTVSALKQSNSFLSDRRLEAGDVLTIQR
jgi:membrane-bound lytic murein transglycosylase D